MSETLTAEPGTLNVPTKRGPGRPPAQPQPQIEQVKPLDTTPDWVTPDEAEIYERMIDKPYIRRNELFKGGNEKFFYRITSMCPYVPAGTVSQTHQHLVLFQMQKYYRNKFVDRKRFEAGRANPKDVKENEEVQWVETAKNSMGTPSVIDSDASFQIDSREFDKIFIKDDK